MRQLMLDYPSDPRATQRDDEYMFGPDLLVAPVIEASAQTRSLYLPRGRWIDFWRSATIGRDGAPRLRAPLVLNGGRTVSVQAPADQIPMFVRAGAALGLLPADVQTLSSYGSGVVHLGDRASQRTLLAWPLPGAPASTASLAPDATVASSATAGGGWLLRAHQARTRRIDLRIALARRPCRLSVNGRPVAFHDAAGVLEAGSPLPAAASAPRRGAHGPRRRPGWASFYYTTKKL